jgi:hypothetical protein
MGQVDDAGNGTHSAGVSNGFPAANLTYAPPPIVIVSPPLGVKLSEGRTLPLAS